MSTRHPTTNFTAARGRPFPARAESGGNGQSDRPQRSPAQWFDRAFPPGWNAATRGVQHDAMLHALRCQVVGAIKGVAILVETSPWCNPEQTARLTRRLDRMLAEVAKADASQLHRMFNRLTDLASDLKSGTKRHSHSGEGHLA